LIFKIRKNWNSADLVDLRAEACPKFIEGRCKKYNHKGKYYVENNPPQTCPPQEETQSMRRKNSEVKKLNPQRKSEVDFHSNP
jgi:hypothetical protein